LGGSKISKTQIARAQAAYGVRERRIVPSNSNIFMNVIANKTSVLLGEKVILSYAIFTRFGTKWWGFCNEGKFQNFHAERIEEEMEGVREVVQHKGKTFVKFEVGSVLLFPLKAGKQTVYPGTAFEAVRSEKDPRSRSCNAKKYFSVRP
jgi:hypothetical protein